MQSPDAQPLTRITTLLGCAWLLASCTGSAKAISLDELIARHTAARGGREAIESVRGIAIDLRGRGHRLELLGRQKLDGIDYYQLLLTLDDGFQVRYFVNPDTWLIERSRELRALHVDIDPKPQWIETVFSDYRPAGGVLDPARFDVP